VQARAAGYGQGIGFLMQVRHAVPLSTTRHALRFARCTLHRKPRRLLYCATCHAVLCADTYHVFVGAPLSVVYPRRFGFAPAVVACGDLVLTRAANPGADVAGASPVPVQMWQGRAQSRCRCGRGEPSPGADVAGASPVPVQMWQGRAQSRRRCGKGEPSPGADVAGASPWLTQLFAPNRWPL
jgi:hypothetical protein